MPSRRRSPIGRLARALRPRESAPDQTATDGPPRPNILLIMTDQQRWDALGCSGGWVETPNMDAIAAEGVRFPNAYTNSPVCVPARVSLATGRYPHNHGVWKHQHYTMPPEWPTWMRAVRDAGYSTSVFGKTHLHEQSGDLRDRLDLLHAYGLDHADEIAGPRASLRSHSNLTERWHEAGVYDDVKRDMLDRYAEKPWVARPSPLPLELYPDVYVARQAADYLRRYEDAKPWLCWLSFGGPHEPWDAPEPYASRYAPEDMPPPLEAQDDGHTRPQGVLDRRFANGRPPFAPGDVERLRANYAGNVTLIDDQVGEVLAVVAERGELDNTVIALVSDHGEMNGDFGLTYKDNFLDPAVRIPFLMKLPAQVGGGARGAVTDALVELMDLGPTLIELAGGKPLPRSFARSVLPVLRDPEQRHRDGALSEHRREIMMATDEWKIAVNRDGEPYLLFDRRSDPQETRNLAALPDYRDVEQELRDRLNRTVKAAGKRKQ